LLNRDYFRRAFANDFRPEKIALYNPRKIHALMNDVGIVRKSRQDRSGGRNRQVLLRSWKTAPALEIPGEFRVAGKRR